MNKKISYVLAILTIAAFVAFVILRQTSEFSLAAFEPYRDLISKGLVNTIYVSLISLLGSLILGFVFYLLSTNHCIDFVQLLKPPLLSIKTTFSILLSLLLFNHFEQANSLLTLLF